MSGTPAPSIVGDVAVPTKTHFHLWGTSDNADGTYRVYDPVGKLVTAFHVRDNRVSELPRDKESTYRTAYDRDLYALKSGFDVGVWSGYGDLGPDTDSWQTGLRYSPLRLLFGTVSADLALSRGAAGVGLSVYPPPDYVGPTWAHIGLGVWYVAPFDGSPAGPVYGLSFSTK
jgi:hypothetical protein